MADITIQKQGEVFISQSEYDALRLAGNLQSNTKYHITKTPKTGVDSLEQMNLLNGDKTVTYTTTDGMTVNGKATLTYDGGTTKDVPMKIDLPIVRGDGIDIHKVDGQEKIAVELIPEEVTYMVLGTSEIPQILALSSTGVEYYEFGQLIPYGIAEYTTDNKLMAMTDNEEISDPNTDTVLVNKAYANQHYVSKRTTAGSDSKVYTFTATGDGELTVSGDAVASTIPFRYSNGTVKVGTPVGVNDATTKAYVDGLHHYSHHIVITDGTSEIFITLAIKNYPNAVTTLDGVTELVEALTGEMQPIMATGVVDGHNVHAVLVQSDRKLYAKFYDSTKGILTDKVQVLFNDTATVHDMVV